MTGQISDIATTATAVVAGYLFEGETAGGASEKVPAQLIGCAFGTSFPGSPSTGDRFYRTDRKIEYFYDGTRWLSTAFYSLNIPIARNLIPVSATTVAMYHAAKPFLDDYQLYVEEFQVGGYLSATGNWSVVLKVEGGGTATLATATVSRTGSGYASDSQTVNTVVSTSQMFFTVDLTKNSGTVNSYILPSLTYRLVG